MLLQDTDWSTLCIYLAQIPCDERRFPPMLDELAKLRSRYPDRLIVLVGPHSERMRAEIEARDMVIFADPGRAMAAVGALSAIGRRRSNLPTGDRDAQARPPRLAPPAAGTRMDEFEAKQVLAHYGLPVLPEKLCIDADQAVRAAEDVGFPVVAKVVSPDIPHKTEIGGVLLNLNDAHAVGQAYHTLMQRASGHAPNARISGVLIAPMSSPGTETILGVHVDPLFGPMVMFGLGGVAVELFRDVAFATAPLDERRAHALIDSVQASRLLKGYRGQAAADTRPLARALVALSYLAQDWRDVLAGIDVNPFVLRADGAVCLDALITLK
jgi:acyl-CoA synthetase (NDP forming)